MKTMGLFLFMLISTNLDSQNPFVDGIHTTKTVEFKDGEKRFNGLGFKIDLIGTCQAKYTATEMWFEPSIEKTLTTETSWNWKDIASLEIDSVKNTLRFNSRAPMPSATEDIDTKEKTSNPDNNNVVIYFKTKLMVRDAAKWVLSAIKKCGGNAMLIN